MTAEAHASTHRADGTPPQDGGRRRPTTRWIIHVVMPVALTAGVFGLLPRLGGLTHDAAALRHARPAFVAAAIVGQAASLASCALLYRRVLASLGARLRFRLVARVILASFPVSHIIPSGSATGTMLNVSTLEAEGVAASTTTEGIGLTSLLSTVALPALFGTGFVATVGRHLSRGYLITAGIALALVVVVLAVALTVGAHPGIAERAGRRVARLARHVPARHRSSPSSPNEQAARPAHANRGRPRGRHRRLRLAAANGGPGRARLPDCQLLAPATSRCGGLPSPPAEPEDRYRAPG